MLIVKTEKVIIYIPFCFISSNIILAVIFVYKIVQMLIPELNEKFPHSTKNYLFIGCVGQYKNYVFVMLISNEKCNFEVLVEWSFFAISQQKQPKKV